MGAVGTGSQTFGSREGKHGGEKVTLTARVGAALCKSASQLPRDTHRQSGRAERGHERCHLISVFGGSAPEDGGLTRLARKRLWAGPLINKQGGAIGTRRIDWPWKLLRFLLPR